jgi:hypothetical protein
VTEPVAAQAEPPLPHGRFLLIGSMVILGAALVLGGRGLLAGASEPLRWAVVIGTAVAFALLGIAAFYPVAQPGTTALAGFGLLGLAVMAALLIPGTPARGLMEVQTRDGDGVEHTTCGEVTEIGAAFVSMQVREAADTKPGAVTTYDSHGRPIAPTVRMLIAVGSIDSMKTTDAC